MAFDFEGFNTIAADAVTVLAELAPKGWFNATGGSLVIEATNPRFAGHQYMRTVTTGRGLFYDHAASATRYAGCAIRFDSLAAREFLSFRDGATTQVEVRIDATGHLICTRNATQIGGTGTTVLTFDTWYHIEFKATINNATGSFEIRLNGATELTGSGLDTQNTANATASRTYFVGTANQNYADLYVSDSAFAGPGRVATLTPSGNGNSSDLIGSDGNSTDNYLLVDDAMTEAFANGDTDYVESVTVGDHDTYAFANLPTVPTSILAVKLSLAAKADDAGAKGIRHVTRSGGTDYEGTTRNLSTSYAYYSEVREVDPATGVAWTASGVKDRKSVV